MVGAGDRQVVEVHDEGDRDSIIKPGIGEEWRSGDIVKEA